MNLCLMCIGKKAVNVDQNRLKKEAEIFMGNFTFTQHLLVMFIFPYSHILTLFIKRVECFQVKSRQNGLKFIGFYVCKMSSIHVEFFFLFV